MAKFTKVVLNTTAYAQTTIGSLSINKNINKNGWYPMVIIQNAYNKNKKNKIKNVVIMFINTDDIQVTFRGNFSSLFKKNAICQKFRNTNKPLLSYAMPLPPYVIVKHTCDKIEYNTI